MPRAARHPDAAFERHREARARRTFVELQRAGGGVEWLGLVCESGGQFIVWQALQCRVHGTQSVDRLCIQGPPGWVCCSRRPIHLMACARPVPHMSLLACSETQTAGRSGRPKSRQRSVSSSCTQRTPAALPAGMPGIGELMDGAVQQAPQAGRQFMLVMLVLRHRDLGTRKRAFDPTAALQILAMPLGIAAVCALPSGRMHRLRHVPKPLCRCTGARAEVRPAAEAVSVESESLCCTRKLLT